MVYLLKGSRDQEETMRIMDQLQKSVDDYNAKGRAMQSGDYNTPVWSIQASSQPPQLATKASFAAASVLPVVGTVVGYLKDLLPSLMPGKKKQVASQYVRLSEAALLRAVDVAKTTPSSVLVISEEFKRVMDSGEMTPAVLRSFGLALDMAAIADRRILEGLCQAAIAVGADLDSAMDILTKPDED